MFLRALTSVSLSHRETAPGRYSTGRCLRVDVHNRPVVAAGPIVQIRTETKAMQDVDAEHRIDTPATITRADRDRDRTTAAITRIAGGRDSDEEPKITLDGGWTNGGRDRDDAPTLNAHGMHQGDISPAR